MTALRKPSLLLTLLLLLAAPVRAAEVLLDGIAAQVGSDIVLVSEVMRIVAGSERRLRESGAPESEIAKLRADGLETMIEWRLIEKVVRDLELYATDAEVDETIANIASENGLSVDQLRASVTTQEMSYDDYRAQIKRELERRKVINTMVAAQVHIEEQQLKDLYKERFSNQPDGGTQVYLRQILIPGGEGTNRTVQQACQQTAEVHKRLLKGESFEELAKQFSASAPLQGGEIGWLHEGSMADWMTAIIGPLEPGQISDVVELPFGCTILKLEERQEFTPITYEQAKPILLAEAREMQMADQYREWMEDLRKHTFIERRGYFADAARFGESTFGKLPREPEEAETP